MAKTLIIKGADFSENKIETVVFDEIPCTALSLSPTEITSNEIGEAITITPTVTPSNTTDVVSWVSSNVNVATVANGVVTTVGIGTAVITATCGEQTATCDVAVSNIVADGVNWLVGALNPQSGYNAVFTDNTGRFAAVGAMGEGSLLTTQIVNDISASPGYHKDISPIQIPQGATQITVSQTGMLSYAVCYVSYYDGTTGGAQAYPNLLQSIFYENKKTATSSIVFDIPSEATMVTFCFNSGSSYAYDTDIEAVAEGFDLTFTFS